MERYLCVRYTVCSAWLAILFYCCKYCYLIIQAGVHEYVLWLFTLNVCEGCANVVGILQGSACVTYESDWCFWFIQSCPLPICPCIPLLEPLCSFGSCCVSLQEVAQRWPSRDSASVGNDGEDRQGSSEEGQSYPCHVRVSKLNFINYATLAIMQWIEKHTHLLELELEWKEPMSPV